jgi:hypothetical protein
MRAPAQGWLGSAQAGPTLVSENVPNEGHGFSRAANASATDGFSR